MPRYTVHGFVSVPVMTIVESDVPLSDAQVREIASVREPRPMQSVVRGKFTDDDRVAWVRSSVYMTTTATLSDRKPTEE